MNNLQNRMEEILLGLGFKWETIGKNEYLSYGNTYCRLTYVKGLNAIVTETADNIADAENGVLEDSDLYYLDAPEEELLDQFKKDVVKYYMD